ncbi:MAG: hypothetical protein Q8P12_04265 [bacterium]|nr:hypothetical protein [bacterium]
MNITERQKTILESLVEGYIQSAHPISSQWLEEEAGFDFSPATIRNELLALTERGYLEQPHVSAGRVPTDRGYRFLVDEIMEELKERELAQEVADHFALLEQLTGSSSALVLGYVPGSRRIFQEGWERLLREPEFGERSSLWNLTKFVEDVAKRMAGFLPAKAMEVYIGKENPFSKVKDFTVIVRRYGDDSGRDGLVAMVGPRRMEYGKNIELLISYGRRKDN